MDNADTLLKRDTDGRIWAHRIKKGGAISQAGSVVSAETADEMLSSGEAVWELPKKSSKPRRVSREQYEREVQREADAGQPVGIEHWSAAMNRDD